ncbi:MAG: nuclear transport factor 2 family protein [Betaproteobacteria bacterium]|nr:nuclear transport factor 2 family protein [Betaproteobacteria bacterium]
MTVRVLLGLLLWVSVSGHARGPAQSPQNTEPLKALEEADSRMGQAWMAKRLDGLLEFYAPTAIAAWSDDPPRVGRDAVRSMWRHRWLDPAFKIVHGTRDALEISKDGDLASMRGGSTFEWTKGKQVVRTRGSWATVWQRLDGRWQVISEVWMAIEDLPRETDSR